jgi:outer membrane protein
VQITIPIFNNGTYRTAYERSKLDLENLKLQQTQATQTLQSNIYTAYSNSVAAMEKYNASMKAVASAQKAYDFATKRYEVGLLSTIDLLTNQNNLLTAKLQQLTNHYDFVFKMKVLEFYKGQGVKL